MTDESATEDNAAVAGRFAAKVVDGHVTEITCECGWEIFAENPWIRGARAHAESGECRLRS